MCFCRSFKQIIFFLFFFPPFLFPNNLFSQKVLEDSVSYSLGNVVQVSEPESGGDLQCEPSVALNKNIVIVSWNDSYGGKKGAKSGVAVGWSISYDSGESFKFGGFLPTEQNDLKVEGADSWLDTDSEGNFYLQVLSTQHNLDYIFVYFMDHKNLGTWKERYTAIYGKGIDKPAMDVLEDGRISIAFTKIENKTYDIYYTCSNNKGVSWSKPIKVSESNNSPKIGCSVKSNNNNLLISWVENYNQIWISSSLDGGKSFSSAQKQYTIQNVLSSVKGYTTGFLKKQVPDAQFSLISSTWLASNDRNNLPIFYLTHTEGNKDGSNIILFKITNNLKETKGPLIIGENKNNYERIFPSISIVNNVPAILYYDRRKSPFTTLTDVYLTLLLSDEKNQDIKVNKGTIDWAKIDGDATYAPFQRNVGDYMTIAGNENKLATTWVEGVNRKSRIFFRLVTLD